MPEPSEADGSQRSGPPRPRPGAAVLALIIIGMLALAGGAGGILWELARPATPAEAQAASAAEVASRWERLPAGQIFPDHLGYVDVDQSRQYLTRLGIARPSACAQSADPAVAQVLVRAGCVTVLRATYVDSSGTLVVTAGVAVMGSAAAATRASEAVGSGGTGVDAYPVPGTMASRFGNAQRQLFAATRAGSGPYLILDTGGFADGRPRTVPAGPALSNLVSSLPTSSVLAAILTRTHNACQQRDIRC